LCADCGDFERTEQIDVLLEFLNSLNENIGSDYPTILGGDFNFDRFRNDNEQRFQYDGIVNAGFIDAYAEYIIAASASRETLKTLRKDKNHTHACCTTGVSELDGTVFRRKNYIFAKIFMIRPMLVASRDARHRTSIC
jgi:hypothetical protein